MKKDWKKQFNLIKRLLENEDILFRIYGVFFLISIFYIWIGVYPLIVSIQRKLITIKNLTEINTQLTERSDALKNFGSILEENQKYIDALNKKIPQDPDVESLLIETIKNVSKSGYVQKSFFVQGVEDGKLNVVARYEGTPSGFTQLITNLEGMERMTSIQAYRYSYQKGISYVDLRTDYFYSGVK